jgi:hypothetical protein
MLLKQKNYFETGKPLGLIQPKYQATSTVMNSKTDTAMRTVSAWAMRFWRACASALAGSSPSTGPDERSMKYPAAAKAPKMAMKAMIEMIPMARIIL